MYIDCFPKINKSNMNDQFRISTVCGTKENFSETEKCQLLRKKQKSSECYDKLNNI